MNNRNYFTKIYLICVLNIVITFTSSAGESKSRSDSVATIKISFTSNRGVVLYYADELNILRTLVFRKQASGDSVVAKGVRLTKPTLFAYQAYDGKKLKKHLFFVNSNDTIELSTNGLDDLALSGKSNKNLYLDSFLDLYDDFTNTKPYNKYSNGEIREHYSKAAVVFNRNKYILDSLIAYKVIDTKTCKYWQDYINIDYYTRLLSPISYNFEYNPRLDLFLEPLIPALKKDISGYDSVKIFQLNSLAFFLTKYFCYKTHRDVANLTDFSNVLFSLKLGVKSVPVLVNQFAQSPNNRQEINSSIEVARLYGGGRFKRYLDSVQQMYSKIGIDDPGKIIFIDYKREKISLKEIIRENPDKIFVLHFWASWCLPCRQELPALNDQINKFKGRSVVFLNISLDEDNRVSDWIKASKDENIFQQENQYKLLTPKSSGLTSALKISSIPRYVVLDKNGEILRSHFWTPSNIKFNKELSSLVQ